MWLCLIDVIKKKSYRNIKNTQSSNDDQLSASAWSIILWNLTVPGVISQSQMINEVYVIKAATQIYNLFLFLYLSALYKTVCLSYLTISVHFRATVWLFVGKTIFKCLEEKTKEYLLSAKLDV